MKNPIKINLPQPKHEQLADWMREKILEKVWPENHKLFSETELATKFKLSRGTVRKAISTLIDEDLLIRIHGRGTFVKQNFILEQQPTGRLAGFTGDLVSRGIPHTTEIIKIEILTPSKEIINRLSISKEQKIFHMERVRLVQDKPVILIENNIILDLCKGVENVDFTQVPFYKTLEDTFNLNFIWAQRTFWSIIANKKVSKTLSLKKGAPIMYLEELYHIENDRPVEFTKAWIDAEVFYISTRINRSEEKKYSPGIYR